ncbi:hypothetical protein IW140_000019 [Coemansia sp. RSA 1813]|nr:hypothetical protein EV178_000179 [Coemansia sp. RSA 1646]KAJ1771352.1 hypothetical protein LPJ74_002392 [Coemansia sp. RSA 1843]KAJ2093125.1 hypothetical protein IW138_000417 [Coemansia sp. RSA 986]KAJ2217609.1 hypothetical protein EV179_000444 [Coemansia sp. RSA 487]KAJ2573378.1 hypothetical protein IW140_000019 [Coemansia sp. RSA 1813]
MERQEETSNQRRRAPVSMPLDKRIQRSYKGKLIKQRIERTKHSNIKRKYFKMLKHDGAQPHGTRTKAQAESANEDAGGESSNGDNSDHGSNSKRTNGYYDDSSSNNERPSPKRKHKAAASDARTSKHNPRANPFKEVLKEKELVQQRQAAERKAREEDLRQANRRRTKYLHDRKQQRKKLNARTSRGQPIMSNQITSLLTKIRKST